MTTNNALFRSFKVRQLTTATGYLSGPTVSDLDSETALKCTITDDTDINLNEDTHEDLGDVTPTAGIVATPVVMTGTTVNQSSGAVIKWDANDVTFTSVTGDQAEQVLVYNDTGTTTTSLLVCKFATATGLPVTPNGGNIVVQWNASGIFTW